MNENSLPEYVTIRLPFHADGNVASRLLSTAWLCKIIAYRVLRLIKENPLYTQLSETRFLQNLREKCYDILSNRRYVDGILKLIYATIRSAQALGVNIQDIELKHWLLFQSEGEPSAKGNNNIKIILPNKIEVLTFDYNGLSSKVVIDVVVPKGWRRLLEVLVMKAQRKEIGYPARVYISDYGIGKNGIHISGEVQIGIPYKLYFEVMKRYDKPLSDLVAGIDVNFDRIDVAILSQSGIVKVVRTFWFPEAVHMGARKERTWSIIGMVIHNMLKWLYHCGVSIIFLEDYEVIGYLKWLWIKKGERKNSYWNWKVATFRSSVIERIVWKAPLYGIKTKSIDPKGTTHSQLHDEIMKKYGVDRHIASAIVIAMKGLKLT